MFEDNLIHLQFPLKPCPLQSFFTNSGHVFAPILHWSFVAKRCISVPQGCISNLVLIVKIKKKSLFILLFFILRKLAKNTSWWPLLPKWLFCRAHSVVDVYQIWSQSGSQGGVVGLSKFSLFWMLIITSSPAMVTSFMSLAHSSKLNKSIKKHITISRPRPHSSINMTLQILVRICPQSIPNFMKFCLPGFKVQFFCIFGAPYG